MYVRRFIGWEYRTFKIQTGCGCKFIVLYNNQYARTNKRPQGVLYKDILDHDVFGCSMGSELTEDQRREKKIKHFAAKQREGLYWALQDRGLGIPYKLIDMWNIKYPDVWHSKTKYGKQKVFKFSYHVKSGELLLAAPGIHHNMMILSDGKFPFNEYVRGIFFRKKRIIYLRMHENLDWLKRTEEVLRMNGLPKSIKVVYGEKAAKRLSKDLEGL